MSAVVDQWTPRVRDTIRKYGGATCGELCSKLRPELARAFRSKSDGERVIDRCLQKLRRDGVIVLSEERRNRARVWQLA